MRIEVGPHTTSAGQRRTALGFELWSEDGVVFLENKKHGEITVLTQKEAKARADAFAEECDVVWDKSKDHGSADDRAYAREQHAQIKRLVEVMYETLNDAKNQGDPNNEAIRIQKLRKFLREKNTATGGRGYMKSLLPALGQAPPKPFKLLLPNR